MLQRCNSKSNARYCGSGVTVCERWRDSFANFLADMGCCPDEYTLDRIDNDRGYEPGNCRWATRTEQNRNRRTALLLTVDGETMTASAWAERLGIEPYRIYRAIRAGKNHREATFGIAADLREGH